MLITMNVFRMVQCMITMNTFSEWRSAWLQRMFSVDYNECFLNGAVHDYNEYIMFSEWRSAWLQ